MDENFILETTVDVPKDGAREEPVENRSEAKKERGRTKL
jgi:hypothetical protein